MSKKIPFLQMFSMLQRWPELAQAVERWLIVSAAIDRTSRSAKVTVEGAAGAGANLVLQVEEAIAKAYGLVSVKLDCLSDMKPEKPAETPEPAPKKVPEQPKTPELTQSAPVLTPTPEMDAFARTEAIRAEALKNFKRVATSAPK